MFTVLFIVGGLAAGFGIGFAARGAFSNKGKELHFEPGQEVLVKMLGTSNSWRTGTIKEIFTQNVWEDNGYRDRSRLRIGFKDSDGNETTEVLRPDNVKFFPEVEPEKRTDNPKAGYREPFSYFPNQDK